VLQRLTADKRAVINWRISTHGTATHVMQSDMPLNSFSPSAFLIACRRVLTTSNGLTARAAVEPAAKPARKEHLQKFIFVILKIPCNHIFNWNPKKEISPEHGLARTITAPGTKIIESSE